MSTTTYKYLITCAKCGATKIAMASHKLTNEEIQVIERGKGFCILCNMIREMKEAKP